MKDRRYICDFSRAAICGLGGVIVGYADFGQTWETMIQKAKNLIKQGWTAEPIITNLDQASEIRERPDMYDWIRFSEWLTRQIANSENHGQESVILEELLALTQAILKVYERNDWLFLMKVRTTDGIWRNYRPETVIEQIEKEVRPDSTDWQNYCRWLQADRGKIYPAEIFDQYLALAKVKALL